MPVKLDISQFINKKFNRLTILEEFEPDKHEKRRVLCLCECGKIKDIQLQHVRKSSIQSCGCFLSQRTTERLTKHGNALISTGETDEYRIWKAMKKRCSNPNEICYKRYGGRGITVCERWKNSFENFLDDMGKRPSKEYSIERRENNGNYEPTNCFWATSKQQNRNTRQNKMITYNEKTKCLAEWCEDLNLNYSTINNRLSRGWTVIKAFETF